MKRINVLLLAYRVAGLSGGLLSGAVAHAIPDVRQASGVVPERTCIDAAGTEVNRTRTGNPDLRSDTCGNDPAERSPATAGSDRRLCIDPFDTRHCFSVRLGTRIGNDRDILGELDGLRVDYRLKDGLTLQGIAGFPVSATGAGFDPARKVFGISAATNRPANPWDVNAFLLEQQNNGNTENQSLGGVVRYLNPEWSWLVYMDYDVAENSWGATTASGAWKIPTGTTLSATLDHRTRPIPGRQLSYLQRSRSALKGWDLLLPADRVAEYGRDGSGGVSALAVGLSQALSRRIHLSGDLSILEAGGDTSADAMLNSRAREYSYHSRLSGTNLLLPGDHTSLDIRYNQSPAGRMSSVALDARYAVSPNWNVVPMLRCDHRGDGTDNPAGWMVAPVLKMEYRRNRRSGLQINAGGTWGSGGGAETADSRGSYFVSLAYQSRF